MKIAYYRGLDFHRSPEINALDEDPAVCILHPAGYDISPYEDFIDKIIGATPWSSAGRWIGPAETYRSLKQSYHPRIVLILGCLPADAGLAIHPSLYTARYLDGTAYILSEDAERLSQSPSSKKQLWAAMKELIARSGHSA